MCKLQNYVQVNGKYNKYKVVSGKVQFKNIYNAKNVNGLNVVLININQWTVANPNIYCKDHRYVWEVACS